MHGAILGIGTDLVEIARMEESLRKFGGRFEQRVFSDAEAAYCRSMPRAAQHYAARFAAKEAFLKALGTGQRLGIAWTEVEVIRAPDGRPSIVLAGRARETAEQFGVGDIHVSMSHTNGHALAVVVLERRMDNGGGRPS